MQISPRTWVRTQRGVPVARYALALGCACAGAAATHALGPYMDRNLLVFLLAGVLVAGLLGGTGPGVVAAVAGGVALAYLFLEPAYSVRITDPADVVRLAMYGALAAIIVVIILVLRRAAERASAREEALRRRDRQLTEARLQALRMQLQPHFLFNALNTVASFVRSGEAEKSLEALERLGALFRFLLDQFQSGAGVLRSELDFVRLYLDLQRLRFGDRLCVELDVEPECLEAEVPPLILQPLVENAFHHGLAGRSGRAELEIRARRTDGALRLEVRDNGRGLHGDGVALATVDAGQVGFGGSGGVGLSNLRSRLWETTDGRGRLDLLPAEGGGTRAVVELPFRRGGWVRHTPEPSSSSPLHPADTTTLSSGRPGSE